MTMGLDQPRHQRGAAAIDDSGALLRERFARLADLLDAIALDQDLARIGSGTGAVENGDIREQGAVHERLPVAALLLQSIGGSDFAANPPKSVAPSPGTTKRHVCANPREALISCRTRIR